MFERPRHLAAQALALRLCRHPLQAIQGLAMLGQAAPGKEGAKRDGQHDDDPQRPQQMGAGDGFLIGEFGFHYNERPTNYY